MSFASFGNDLYTGARSINMIGRRRLWYAISIVVIAICLGGLGIRGISPGLEFTGGTEITVAQVDDATTATGRAAVEKAVPEAEAIRVSALGDDGIRFQSSRLDDAGTDAATEALTDAYGVSAKDVTVSSVGPTWGADVTRQAVIALFVFLALAALVLSIYFRTWRMSAAAMIALLHDVIITAGVYAIIGLEVTPATVIGFLTILGYSLYDTVVVFDKVRENTAGLLKGNRLTYGEAVNLAVNQTLIRSINTSVVALLPVGSILFIGALVLKAATLTDIALALFVGLIAGTYSSVFIAPAVYTQLTERRPEVMVHTGRVQEARESGGAPRASGGTAVAGSRLGAASSGGSAPTAVKDRPSSGPSGGSVRTQGTPAAPGAAESGGRGARASGEARRGAGDAADERPRRGPRNQPTRKGGRRR